jgi:hydroxymethylbilane synthase
MLPSAGQGALGIEVRSERQDVIEALAPLAHDETWLRVTAERAVSRAMGGSCSMPLAAFATVQGDRLTLAATWGDPEGELALVRVRSSARIADLTGAEALGAQVALDLRAGILAQGGTLASFEAPQDAA